MGWPPVFSPIQSGAHLARPCLLGEHHASWQLDQYPLHDHSHCAGHLKPPSTNFSSVRVMTCGGACKVLSQDLIDVGAKFSEN
jgi:hypothetical protein